MNHLIRSELRKLTSVTWWKVTMIATLALIPIAAIINVQTTRTGRGPALGSPANVHHVLASSALTSMVMLASGIAIAASEYRHGTSIPTYLTTPRRPDVILAKLLAATAIGSLLGGIAFGFAVAVAVPMFAARGVHHLAGDTTQMFVGAVLVTALYGALGVALGAMTRSVVGAMVAALIWVQIFEQAFLDSVLPQLGRWLPTGANLAISHTGSDPHVLLAPAAAALVLVGWTAVLSIAAIRLTVHRDV